MRKKEIAEKARLEAEDGLEVVKRKELKMLRLMNHLLIAKTKKSIQEFFPEEKVLNDIKAIVGFNNMDDMLDKILNKNSKYNEHVIKSIEALSKLETLTYEKDVFESHLNGLFLNSLLLKRRNRSETTKRNCRR